MNLWLDASGVGTRAVRGGAVESDGKLQGWAKVMQQHNFEDEKVRLKAKMWLLGGLMKPGPRSPQQHGYSSFVSPLETWGNELRVKLV